MGLSEVQHKLDWIFLRPFRITHAVLTNDFQYIDNVVLQSVTFDVMELAPDAGALKYSGGVTNELVMEHQNNVGTPLASAIQASTTSLAFAPVNPKCI